MSREALARELWACRHELRALAAQRPSGAAEIRRAAGAVLRVGMALATGQVTGEAERERRAARCLTCAHARAGLADAGVKRWCGSPLVPVMVNGVEISCGCLLPLKQMVPGETCWNWREATGSDGTDGTDGTHG